MNDHPLRDPEVLADLERKAMLLAASTAGKLTVELNYKDGTWSLGNVSVTWPRKHGG